MYDDDVVVFGHVVVETSSALKLSVPLVEDEASVDLVWRGVVRDAVVIFDEAVLLPLVVVASVEVVGRLVVGDLEVATDVVVVVIVVVVVDVVVGLLVVVGNGEVEVVLEVEEEIGDVAVLVAVAKNPDSFEANFSAAQILGRTGSSSEEILPYYEKATEIEPSNSKALRELASAYYDLGEKEKSIQVFENAISNEENELKPLAHSL